MECAKEITCRATIDKNMERMGRLLGLETNVQTVFASSYYTTGFALTAKGCMPFSSCMEDVGHQCKKSSSQSTDVSDTHPFSFCVLRALN